MNKVLLITGLSIIAILGIIVADATLNPPTSWSRGTKIYQNYTDMQNETGLRNGSISNITWIGFTPEKVNGTLQPCPLSAENNATLCYNQTTNNLTVSYNGSIRYRILDNRTSITTSTIFNFQNVTTGRAVSTVYQNTNTTARKVSFTGYGDAGTPYVTVYTDTSTNPTTIVGKTHIQSSVNGGNIISFIVLPNSYYKIVDNPTVTIAYWIEWN